MLKIKCMNDAKPVVLIILITCFCALAQDATWAYAKMKQDDGSTKGAAEIARRLASPDPLARQRAAEELARLSATDQQKMVAGYRLQEKNARVKLALDWALYRMGKTDALFSIVRELDSSRRNQAESYLTQLDSPEPLYIFLNRANHKIKIRLLEVLASIGDSGTLARIEPYTRSLDPRMAEAARFSQREITRRLASAPTNAPTRPRIAGTGENNTP